MQLRKFDFDDAPKLLSVLMYIVDVTLQIGHGHNVSFMANTLGQPFPHTYERMNALQRRGLIEWVRYGPGRVGMFRATRETLSKYMTPGEAERLRLTPTPGYSLSDNPDTMNAWYQPPLL